MYKIIKVGNRMCAKFLIQQTPDMELGKVCRKDNTKKKCELNYIQLWTWVFHLALDVATLRQGAAPACLSFPFASLLLFPKLTMIIFSIITSLPFFYRTFSFSNRGLIYIFSVIFLSFSYLLLHFSPQLFPLPSSLCFFPFPFPLQISCISSTSESAVSDTFHSSPCS